MKVGIVGATGVVGETLLRVLEERNVPVDSLLAFASRHRTAGVRFRGEDLDVSVVDLDALGSCDAVFFASSEDASGEFAPPLAQRGTVCIDNSATFRLQPHYALIVPEVNGEDVRPGQRIFPVANCSAIILTMALSPVRNLCGLLCVHVATYQAVSGAGRAGLEELARGEAALYSQSDEPAPQTFAAPIVRNVIPQIGTFEDDGYTTEESKIRAETRKILWLPDLDISVMAIRVPVLNAHSQAVFFETERSTTVAALADAFAKAPGIVFHPDGIVTPRDVEGSDAVHVARLRAEDESGTRFAVWVVGDQLRKGAATNGVQILELLLARGQFEQ